MKASAIAIITFFTWIFSWLLLTCIFAFIGMLFSNESFKACFQTPFTVILSFVLALAFAIIVGNDLDEI